MKNAWIVIGGRNTRKSSIIRALTGVGQRHDFKLETFKEGTLDFWAEICALQEKPFSIEGFIDEMKKKPDNLLFPLWIDERVSKKGNFPDAKTYIQAFIKNGWKIKEIVALGVKKLPYSLPTKCPEPLFLPSSTKVPTNVSARKVRKRWNWL